LSQQHDDQQPEKKGQKKKNQIIFVISSFSALIIVGVIAFFALSKIKENKDIAAGMSQDQFEGEVQISSQLQAECQSSAAKISKMQDAAAMETEYRQNAENCKDVYFALEVESAIRKEGMYADIVVDIAKKLATTDKAKAVDLLKFAREIKTWDFYLGPTSCESQQVLDAYIESFSSTDEKICVASTDIQSKLIPELVAKNFALLSKISPPNEVVWLGAPESDLGCPEKISSILEILKKLTTGSVGAEVAPSENDGSQVNVSLKLSDKETITLVLQGEQSCLKLNSVLIPNPETTE
jgi:hypothetical protein